MTEHEDCDKICGEHKVHKDSVNKMMAFYGLLLLAIVGWFNLNDQALSTELHSNDVRDTEHTNIDSAYHQKVDTNELIMREFQKEQRAHNIVVLETLGEIKGDLKALRK